MSKLSLNFLAEIPAPLEADRVEVVRLDETRERRGWRLAVIGAGTVLLRGIVESRWDRRR
jgi:hypothetical protein